MENVTRVGLGVFIMKNNKILLGKRISSHGKGTRQLAGGHLDFMESFIGCAKRETLEETNLKIKDVTFLTTTNDFFDAENKHYVTIFMKSKYAGGELKTMEPEKCEYWKWFSWDDLPSPLMIPLQNFLKLNINPFDNN